MLTTPTGPFVFVIFGATGDLARNKLFPALFSLYKQGALGKTFYLVGFARKQFTDQSFREHVAAFRKVAAEGLDKEWQEFAKHIHYQQGVFEQEDGYQQLIEKLKGFDDEVGACITRIFYLATPPSNYETILNFLETTKLSQGCGQGSNQWTRLAVEKPFGNDLETAKSLDQKLATVFEERQIFRVDHYLGKETVQNMLAFRFANGIFEPVWNNEYIDHVQITFAEKEGIGSRGNFFDGVGMLRDVGQNHVLQLAASIVMEQPVSFSKEAIRDARAKAMGAIQCIEPEQVVSATARGQYSGYTEEKHVTASSATETFVAFKTSFTTPRFAHVPFYIRAGKALEKERIDISLVFKQTCHILFKEYGCPEIGNVLTIRIQPHEGISMRVITKQPGSALALGTVDMQFSYKEAFGTLGPDAYEKLLLDILTADQMLFNRSDELESSWEFITKILQGWEQQQSAPEIYKKGTWGPASAFALIEKDGRKWL